MKRKWWTVCFLSILAGSALHFLYDLWPNPLTAVFAPVNESVWEHLKLLYWPFLAAAFVLTKDEADGRKSWCGLLAGLLGAPLLLLGAYYTLLSGFALYGLPLDPRATALLIWRGRFHAIAPRVGQHSGQCGRLARIQSRCTVRSELPIASAVSSSVSPAK